MLFKMKETLINNTFLFRLFSRNSYVEYTNYPTEKNGEENFAIEKIPEFLILGDIFYHCNAVKKI